MPIRSNVDVMLAKYNLAEVEAGRKPISIRELARRTKISQSSLFMLLNNRTTRVDLQTIERLMRFFDTRNVDDILKWVDHEDDI